MENFDSQTFKVRDAKSYDSVTDEFDFYTERVTRELAARMVSLADIESNDSVLDVGTGTGIVALQAAQMLGSNGEVHGIDLSEAMVDASRRKAARTKFSAKVRFSPMDAEALDFDERTFDKVLSLYALLHFPNPLVALKEISRVMRPGGKLVLAVGSRPPIFSLTGWLHRAKHFPDFVQRFRGNQLVAPNFLDALVEENLPLTGDPEESELASHSHNRTQPVAELIGQAGLEILKTDWHGNVETLETAEEFWEIQRTFSSIARKRINAAAQEKVELLRLKFLEKCRSVQSSGGKLVYPFGAFYVVARKPQ